MSLFGLALLLGVATAGNPTFSVPVIYNPNWRLNPLAEYQRMLNRYSGLAERFGIGGEAHNGGSDIDQALVDGTGSIDAVNQPYDREYLSPIQVGTPPQTIWMDLDTGSADTWTYTSETSSGFLRDQAIYSPEKSTSSEKVPNATWYITYGDGSYAAGNVYRDNMEIGGVKVHDAIIQSASHVSPDMTNDLVMSGVMGLCRNHSSTVHPSQQTVFGALQEQLDRPLFGVDLHYHAEGKYDFGFINTTVFGKEESDLEWRDLLPHDDFWTIHVEKVHVGGTNLWYKHAWPMVVDTGTTLLMLPRSLTKIYYDQVPSAAFDGYWGAWLYDCNATLPDWEFGFTNGWSQVVPGQLLAFQNVTATRCVGGIQNNIVGSEFGILGDAWLKTMYVVFDAAGERVGLAKKPVVL